MDIQHFIMQTSLCLQTIVVQKGSRAFGQMLTEADEGGRVGGLGVRQMNWLTHFAAPRSLPGQLEPREPPGQQR